MPFGPSSVRDLQENWPQLADLEDLVHSQAISASAACPSSAAEPDSAPRSGSSLGVLCSLENQDGGASAEEHLIHLLVAGEWQVSVSLEQAKLRLAARMLEVLDEPRAAAAVGAVLRDVIQSSSSVSRRIEALLLASTSLRVQRRMFVRSSVTGGPNGV